ncbi:MAG: flagellar basal body-associated FliL family protein [Arcobacteraceae bacterium]
MADEEVAVQEQKSKGKGLIISLIVLIILLIIMMAGGGYFLYNNMKTEQTSSSTAGNQMAEEKVYKDFYQVQINDMVLNITNTKGREKLMKLSFTINSIEDDIEVLMDQNKPEIVDLVIALISSRNSEELLTVGGKELLKEELILEINSILNRAIGDNSSYKKDSVKNIFFTAFVIK